MRKIFYIFLIGVGVILYIFISKWTDNYLQRQWRDNFNAFNSADLKGVVERVGIKNHGVLLRIKSIDKDFVFYPYTNSRLNNSTIFQYIAEKGDSVFKPSFSDTLVLKKGKRFFIVNFKSNIH